MYNMTSGGRRGVGLTARDGPKGHLLSTFPKPSSNPEPLATKTQVSSRANGNSARSESSEDELGSSRAPSVTTSPRGTRIHRRTTVPETGKNNYEGMSSHDEFIDINDFDTLEPQATRSLQPYLRLRGGGDITSTVFRAGESQTPEEHQQETQRLLREKRKDQVNPQYMRGAGYDADSVRQQEKRVMPSNWETGKHRRKQNTYAKKNTNARPRLNTQTKKLSGNLDTGDEDVSQSTASKQNVLQPKREFKDPTKLYALSKAKEVSSQWHAQASQNAFQNPMIECPVLLEELGNQSDSTATSSCGPRPKNFQDPIGTYKGKVNLPIETGKSKSKAFIDPFRKYDTPPEPESQMQGTFIDESDESDNEIIGLGGSGKGGPEKRKAYPHYPKVDSIDLSTPRATCREEEDLPLSPNSSIGEPQSSIVRSQLSSQVRHLEAIRLGLEGAKLREQVKKRKAEFETIDNCTLCDAALPLGTLDNWRNGDGELGPIRMFEWTEICNNHKAADLQKKWKEKGYPIIEWKGLKKRVEEHHQFLVDIVEDKVVSPFRQVFAKQQKDTRGNAALLLRKNHQLQYPGYYGPRGSGILLHEITMRLGSFVADTGKRDGLIGQGGVSAFIQTVLVPELGVRLIMEDMDVSEPEAREILDESREIGEKLNMNEFTGDIYDEDDGPWFDINATQTPAATKKKKSRLEHSSDESDC